MKPWGRKHETVDDFIDVKIYPSKKGWKILEDREREEAKLLPSVFDRVFNGYVNEEENSYLMSADKLCEMLSDFLTDDTLTVKKSRIVKSRMKKYLEYRKMTLQQWKSSIAALVWNESC